LLRMEILNGAAIYATSVLLFFVARRAAGARAATSASLLYACHSLVFRYHVWAREFFVSALVLGAVLAVADVGEVVDGAPPVRRKILTAASLLSAACAIKLTAVVAVAAIVGYVAAGMRAPRLAAALGGTVAAAFTAFVAFCCWRYGEAFVFQAFLFHFLKGRGGADAGPFYIASLLDVLGPLALFGSMRLADRRRWNGALGLAAAVLAADVLFIAVLSPTAWGHNYLEAWPLVALLGGAGVDWLIDACRGMRLTAAAAAIVAGVLLVWVTPLDNEAALRGSVYGFGFVPRAELATLAAGLASASDPQTEVVAPSFIAFEANRLQAIRYPENIGVMTAAHARWRADGLAAARREFGSRSFFDLIDQTSHIWNDQFARAIAAGGPVNAVIPDSPVQLLPLVNASPGALIARGFRLSARTAHFTLWVRAPGRVES
jgi:hypothetical protein